jgi:hypothetical protein
MGEYGNIIVRPKEIPGGIPFADWMKQIMQK